MSGGIFMPLDVSQHRSATPHAGDGLSFADMLAMPADPDAALAASDLGVSADVGRRPDVYGRLAQAAYRQTLTGELTTSTGILREESYDRVIDAVKAASGVQLENPSRGGYAAQAERDVSDGRMRNAYTPETAALERQQQIFEEKLDELTGGNPDLGARIAALRELYAPAAIAQRADRDFREAFEAAPSAAGAFGASLIGGLPAMLRDPVNVAGLFVTGGESAAAGVVARIASTMAREAAVNAGLTAVAQPMVQTNRAELGLEHGLREAAGNIGMAAAFGGGFGALFGGGRELLRGQLAAGLPERETALVLHGIGAEASDVAARAGAPAAALDGVAGRRAYEQAVDFVQLAEAPPPELVFDFGQPEPRRQRVTREELPARPGESAIVDGKPVRFERFQPSDLETDAAAFQYKGGGDAAGVTERLRSVSRWDPVASGKVLVFEAENGARFVADGHQRLGLAKRLSAADDTIRLDGFLFKERDGWTRADVRALAAKKNMQEGSGDAVDAARVLRDRPDLADGSLPTTAPMMRQAIALSKLSDEAWGMTLNGVVPPSYAAAVGGTVADPLQHAAVLALLREAQPETERAARLLIGEAMEAGFTVEKQIDLFGAADATRSLMAERVAVLDAALTALRKDKRLFGTLAAQADAIEAGGNVLARATNETRAQNAGGLEDILVKLARRSGPISDALNVQAARVADGTARTTASRAFLDQLQAVVEKRGLIGLLKDAPELRPAAVVEPGSAEAARIGETARATEKPAEATPEAAVERETASEWRPMSAIRQRIEDAYLSLTGGDTAQAVKLSALRAALPDLDRAAVDAGLAEILRGDPTARLSQYSDPKSLNAAERAAAYAPAGEPFHIVWLQQAWPERPSVDVASLPEAPRVALETRYEAWQAAPAGEKAGAAEAYLADWSTAFDDLLADAKTSGGTTSGPKDGSNVARQTGSGITDPEWATSTASAGDQPPSGSRMTTAAASSTDSTAGRDFQSRKNIAASEAPAEPSLHEAVPLGTREDGGDARMLTREAALAEADRAELYADLVAACRQ